PRKEAEAMQGLVETVFAVPFCEDENAGGRYGRALRELPLTLGAPELGARLKVEAKVRVPASLPIPEVGFAQIIKKVRESSGKNLRAAMAQLGDEPSFQRLEQAWRFVAAEMAQHIGRKKKAQKVD